jgi:hypothetical protein
MKITTLLTRAASVVAALGDSVAVAPRAASPSPRPCAYCGPPPCDMKPIPFGNPGLQSGRLAPWVVDYDDAEPLTNFSVVHYPQREEQYAVRIDTYINRYSEFQPKLWQVGPFGLCRTYRYRISFAYKVLKSFPETFLFVGPQNADPRSPTGQENLHGIEVPTNVTGNWQQASGSCGVHFAESMAFQVNTFFERSANPPRPGPSVLVDNITMVPVASLVNASCPFEPAPLANSHFQTGALAPWTAIDAGPSVTYAIVNATADDGQPYALRITVSNSSDVEPQLEHGITSVCLGWVYVFELQYNVVTALATNPDGDYNTYTLYMVGCFGVNRTTGVDNGFDTGPARFNTTGPGTIKMMCRFRHNGPALFRFVFFWYYPGYGIVDILGLSARLATADDFN